MLTETLARVEIDFGSLPTRERHAHLLHSFDRLRPGEAMVLNCGQDPRPLLYHLQGERRGQFDWSPLEDGPEVFRVRIDRRDPGAPLDRAVSEYLAWDHDRLDHLLAAWRSEAERGDWGAARRLSIELATGLMRHIRMEETILFPAYDERGRMHGSGPTLVMREEHRQIESLLDQLVRTTAAAARGEQDGALARFAAALAELGAVLGDHNVKEEHVIYPAVDDLHERSERDNIVAAMQRL